MWRLGISSPTTRGHVTWGTPGSRPRRGRTSTFWRSDRSTTSSRRSRARRAWGATPRDVGKLAALQKEIIVATWRLDQAPHPAAVADDIRAVGEVQGELRDTAARAAEQVLGRGREVSTGDTGLAPESAAMARAVEAMTNAQGTLAALNTETSLPHEMEALNQLLKAQATIRRRQVAMQQGQGSQTPGTQAQEDLSALFDRELRREQETNYESGTSPNDQRAQGR